MNADSSILNARSEMPRVSLVRSICYRPGPTRLLVTYNRILFISSQGNFSWGGAEELWSRAALYLAAEGFAVSASYPAFSPPDQRIVNLIEHGVDVWSRPRRYPLRKRAWRALVGPEKTPTTTEVERLVTAKSPEFVVISDGAPFPPLDLLEMCATKRLPFIIIVQCNHYYWWPGDALAERYRTVLAAALRCYFVSEANRRIAEKQIGCELLNAELVRNPLNVRFNASPPWPPLGPDDELSFACVARLEPTAKRPGRSLRSAGTTRMVNPQLAITLVWGEVGDNRGGLERWAHRLGITDRVVFEGTCGRRRRNLVAKSRPRHAGHELKVCPALWSRRCCVGRMSSRPM
jgi:hypothetical protein